MSAWGKLLCEVVIPTGGYTFAWSDGGPQDVTVPAGTYATILHVAAALETAIESIDGSTVSVSQLGVVTVDIDGLTAADWANTDDALSSLLGFDESETVATHALTSSTPHTHGWYPGAITYSNSIYRGVGLADGALWLPDDVAIRTRSGAGDARIVLPGILPRRRMLRFDLVSLEEARHPTRGVAAMMETHLAKRWYWYLDREVGTPGTYGDRIDPWSETDDDGDYYIVTFDSQPKLTRRPETPRRFSVELELGAEAMA